MRGYILVLTLLFNFQSYSQNKDSVSSNKLIVPKDSIIKIIETRYVVDSTGIRHQLDSMKYLLAQLTARIEDKNNDSWVPFWAYIVAGVISLVVALLTIRANVISKARINWIQNLRNTMSEFLSLSESVTEYKKEQDRDESKKDIHISHITRMLARESKLKLLLNNKKESSQSNLVKSIIKYREGLRLNQLGEIDTDIDELKEDCISKSQDLLKKEWDFAKKESYWIIVFRRKAS